MTRDRAFLVALVVAPLLIGVELLIHELLHVAINLSVTGSLASCGLGPLTVRDGRLWTCYAEAGVGPWNDLVTPVVMAASGVALMHYSASIRRDGVRRGVLVAGAAITLYESLYAVGALGPPIVWAQHPELSSDGLDAIRAFGPTAILPGLTVCAVGFWVLVSRVSERPPSQSLVEGTRDEAED